MTEKIPQFYHRWIPANLGVPFPSGPFRFPYHEGEHYAYLIGPGSRYGSDNLFIYVFLHTDVKGRRKEPVPIRRYQIQDSDIVGR